jgi:transcriptional regulator with GAF, ATPase, and Fis domain/Tfp pilus assembly protein PilF
LETVGDIERARATGADPSVAPDAVAQLRARLADPEISAEAAERLRLDLADRLEADGRIEEAIAATSALVDARRRSRNDAAAADVWIRLGRLHHRAGNAPRAIHCANSALKTLAETDAVIGCVQANLLLGRIYADIDEYAIARDHLERAREELQTVRTPRLLAECHWRLAVVAHHEGRIAEAREEGRRGVAALNESGEALTSDDEALLGNLLGHLAAMAFEQGDLSLAISKLENAIERWRRCNEPHSLAVAYDHLADAQLAVGEWTAAEISLEKALECAAASPQAESMTLRTFSKLLAWCGRFEEAERKARRAAECAAQIGVASLEAGALEALGEVRLMQDKPDEARALFERSLHINIRINRLARLPGNHLRLAEAYLLKGDLVRAETHLTHARALFGAEPKLHLTGLCARLEGRLRVQRKEYAEGLSLLVQSVSLFESAGFVYEAAYSNLHAGLALLAQENGARAVTHLEAARAAFSRLNARPAKKRAEAALATARTLLSASAPESPPALDALLIARLIAADSPDLLLRELVILLRDEFRLEAVIFEYLSDGLRLLTGEMSRAERMRRDLLATLEDERPLPEGLHARSFGDSRQPDGGYLARRFFLCISGDLTPKIAECLDALLHVAELALENGRLRNAMRASRTVVSDAQVGGALAAVGLTCESPAMLKVAEKITKIQSSDVTVLITGESGVGKELVARALHVTSRRRQRAFLPFNCAAIPADLVESRLFGHRQGSFTGANKDAAGIIRAAAGGTLFLDEIGELSLHVQPKLLRFLQEHEIHPVGEERPITVDVRIVAATNRNLEQEVERGAFREDLFHRLNVVRIHVPPLRERREDMPGLIRHLLRDCSQREGKAVELSEAAQEWLAGLSWLGNVRQLKNEIERAVALAEPDTVLTPEHFSPDLWRQVSAASDRHSGLRLLPATLAARGAGLSAAGRTLAQATADLERQMLWEALERHKWNVTHAARELGLTRQGLILKRKRYGLGAAPPPASRRDHSR